MKKILEEEWETFMSAIEDWTKSCGRNPVLWIFAVILLIALAASCVLGLPFKFIGRLFD
ncbi:MAG TPA: hypothetical protein P5548_03595 [Candidatus Moranbacteria bacterium]|nr:hypothetical protein [Candidatus Moranbacteria bacterium]HRZ33953.1 hypothetical protein [Candidatus Moranbacteria bacterium]